MYKYEKKLPYPLNIKRKDLKMAKYLLSQFGGANSELAASLRYFSQKFTMPDKEGANLLNDIATEELGHIEMIAGMIHMLTKDATIDEIKEALDAKKIQHTEAVMYRTVSNDFGPDEAFDYDMLLFFSPAGINSLMKNFPGFEQKEIAIGCFGPATAKAVKDAGLRLDLEAPTVETPSMTAALDKFIGERNKD